MSRRSEHGIASQAMALGRDLALGILRIWRRDLDWLDGLILLVVTLANVDGVLFNRELRGRYGGLHPIAPNDLRQPLAGSVVAVSLGLPRRTIERRIGSLVERGECELTAEGLLVTEQQIDATSREAIVRAVYELLRISYARLKQIGLFEIIPLLPSDPPEAPPLRSGPTYGGKYVLRTLDAFAPQFGDVGDVLVLLEAMRLNAVAQDGRAPATVRQLAEQIGMPPGEARRRIRNLVEIGVCARVERGVVIPERVLTERWFQYVERRNLDNLFQLFAALAEIGAVADFDARQ